MTAATVKVEVVTERSLAPRSKDFRQSTLKTAKPNPANAASPTPAALNPEIPIAVPTRMMPKMVTAVPRYQLR